jgi:hypothetical protein
MRLDGAIDLQDLRGKQISRGPGHHADAPSTNGVFGRRSPLSVARDVASHGG